MEKYPALQNIQAAREEVAILSTRAVGFISIGKNPAKAMTAI